MAARRRSSRSALALVAMGLLALLAVLATLQYRWLGQVSAAERARLLANARSRAEAFARDFDREITRAYLHLQMDSGTLHQRAWDRYAAKYEEWRGRAAQPDMVAAVYVAEPVASGEPRLSRFDVQSKAFTPAEWPASLEPFRRCLVEGAPAHSPSLMPIAEDVPALVSLVPDVLTLEDRALPEATRTASAAGEPGVTAQGTVVRFLARRDALRPSPLTIVVLDPAVLGGA